MRILLHTEYPIQFFKALELLHSIQQPNTIEIIRTDQFDSTDVSDTAVFMIDESKRGLDLITENQYRAGFKVFAFKINAVSEYDPFQLSITTLKFWPQILSLISETKEPFIFTYHSHSRSLTPIVVR